MEKLKHIVNESHIHNPNLVTIDSMDSITQAEFNSGVRELCSQFNIPHSLVICLMVNHVANSVNRAEGKDQRYQTLKDLNECLTVGDRNWMKFIPEWKYESPVFIDRLDIGLIRAFYHNYVKTGMHPAEAFRAVEKRNVEIDKFFTYANGEVATRRSDISSAWFDYKDLYIYAGRVIFENPVKPERFALKFTERKGIALS